MAKPLQVLILEPNNELAFKGPFTEYVNANLTLTNPSPRDVYFKVKTTAPKFYCVRPNFGVIQAKDKAQINVMLKQPVESPEILENERNRHKFMIQSAFAQEGDQPPAVEQFWNSVDPAQIMDSKLRVVLKMSDMPDVYKNYSIRSEYSLFVEFEDSKKTACNLCQNRGWICFFNEASNKCNYCQSHHYTCNPPPNNGKTSNLYLSIDGKTWSVTYSPSSQTLGLEMSMLSSDKSKTIAELIFWYWGDMDIVIMKKTLHTFGVKSRSISVPTNGSSPVNKKLNIVIRFLDEQITNENNSLESYYGNLEGVETVTLCVCGTDNKNTSFVVPKYVLMNASPVFRRMFANEMTEKATGIVEIEDTNPEEFGDFLKAISPKQEHPNPSNVLALMILADRYEVKPLLDRCEAHLMNCVEIPLVHLLNCANFYRLKKLKANLLMSIEGTGLFKLFQQSKPHLGVMNFLKMLDDF